MTITFTVEIDWAHDGSWTDETSRTRRVQVKSGFDEPGRAVAATGRCVLTMDNRDQRFSPGYLLSPLYGDLLPRRQVRVTASDAVFSWVIFRGFVDDIAPDAGKWGAGECVITCVDAIALLEQQRIGVAHEDSKAVDDAVDDVVSTAYAPPAWDYADNGDELTHYGRSWEPERTSCLDAVREIAEAVYGRFFIARDGTPTYRSRDEAEDSSASAVVTLGDVEYWQVLKAVQPYHLIAYWRLNESQGTTATDSSGNGYDGTASGVTWGEDGIGDGSSAAGFDGVNDRVDVYSAGLAGAFDGDEGTLLIWLKLLSADAWSDGSGGYAACFMADSSNYVAFQKHSYAGRFRVVYKAGGTTKLVDVNGLTTADFACVAITWDKSADEVKVYWNGVQQGTTQTGLGTWAGALASTGAVLGAYNVYAQYPFPGYLAHGVLWDVALTPGEIAQISGV